MVIISPQESTVGGGRGLMTTIFKNKRDECHEAGEREFPEKVRVMCARIVPKKDLVYSGFFGAGASQWILFVPKCIARVCDENAA